MVSAEQSALMAFTSTAACILSPKRVKMRAINWKVGFPGGCPTSSLYEDAMNSPQSQKDAVGSMVLRYVNADTTKANAAAILFHKLNDFVVIDHKYRHFFGNRGSGLRQNAAKWARSNSRPGTLPATMPSSPSWRARSVTCN